MYTIRIEKQASKRIASIETVAKRRVVRKIRAFASDPRLDGCRKLSGSGDVYRIRVGDYRIVYLVLDAVNVVAVTKVGHRKDIYRR